MNEVSTNRKNWTLEQCKAAARNFKPKTAAPGAKGTVSREQVLTAARSFQTHAAWWVQQ